MLSGRFRLLSMLKMYNSGENEKIDLVNGDKKHVRRPKTTLSRKWELNEQSPVYRNNTKPNIIRPSRVL
jgi:hypothetical protein